MIPSAVEVEHADWATLKAYCDALGLNPKGRSAVVRQRVLDHVAARAPAATWRAGVQEIAAFLTRVGHPDEAARLWESTLSLDTPAPWVGLGGAYLRAGELEKAAKAFDRAAQMGDSSAAMHRTEVLAAGGKLDLAIEEAARYRDAHPGDPRGLALMVSLLSRAGRHEQVAQLLQRSVGERPDARPLRSGLGWALLRMSRFEEAVEAYRVYLDAAPSDSLGWNNYGVALAKAGKLPEARKAFQRAVSVDPSYPEALNNLGCVEVAQGLARGSSRIQKAKRLADHPRIAANAERAARAARSGRAPRAKRNAV